VKGDPITNPPESIRLYALCKSLGWAALPNAGGLYDQHPKLISEWETLISIESEHERKESAERERAQTKSSSRKR
jgi:hypothetical protein